MKTANDSRSTYSLWKVKPALLQKRLHAREYEVLVVVWIVELFNQGNY